MVAIAFIWATPVPRPAISAPATATSRESARVDDAMTPMPTTTPASAMRMEPGLRNRWNASCATPFMA
jgi:hypothetical protein